MKTTKLVPITTVLSTVTLLTPSLALGWDVGGIDIGIQPRIEGGVSYYEFKASPVSIVEPSSSMPGNIQFGRSFTQGEFKFKDTLPTLGGGLTIFVDRFFLDFSAQRAFDGSDSTNVSTAEFIEGGNPGTIASCGGGFCTNVYSNDERNYKADFDRDDYAISFGYSINDQISVYAGYKWAKTDFKTKSSGPFSILLTPPVLPNTAFSDVDQLEGQFESNVKSEFEYDGPFIGVTYGLKIDQGFFTGNLSFNFAAALLDGKYKVKSRSEQFTLTSIDGVPVPPADIQGTKNTFSSDGDTTGFTFGINWRGLTPVDGLTYSLGLSAYSYDFDANNDEDSDITEMSVNFKVGAAYAF